MSGSGNCPSSSVSKHCWWYICLFHQQLYNFRKREHEKLIGVECSLMRGTSVCHNPLELPVHLWTTSTVMVCIVHYVKFVSVISSVSLSLSLPLCWEVSSSCNEFMSESDSNIGSSTSHSVSFSFVAVLNPLQHSLPYNKPSTVWIPYRDSSFFVVWPAVWYWCDREQTGLLS
jgi:hypothetical protein